MKPITCRTDFWIPYVPGPKILFFIVPYFEDTNQLSHTHMWLDLDVCGTSFHWFASCMWLRWKSSQQWHSEVDIFLRPGEQYVLMILGHCTVPEHKNLIKKNKKMCLLICGMKHICFYWFVCKWLRWKSSRRRYTFLCISSGHFFRPSK